MSAPSSRRRAVLGLIARVIDLIAIGGVLAGFGLLIQDLARQEIANPQPSQARLPDTPVSRASAAQAWPAAKQRLAATLRQERLELGAVWMTRSGRICGLVNGWGSFGGLTGMTRFYSVGERFAFSIEPPGDFYLNWSQCRGDHWQVLHAGSEEPGFCATKLGRRRCGLDEGPG